jgi:hypothetical protein
MVALFTVCREAVFYGELLDELGIPRSKPIKVYTDSLPSVNRLENVGVGASAQRLRFLLPKIETIKEYIQKDEIILEWIPGQTNIADALTKPMLGSQFEELIQSLLNL